jgi:hypothetical protein
MSKHSPGPWSVADGGAQIQDASRTPLALMCSRTEQEWQANAQLISLAPEMASLLKRMHKDLEGHWLADHDERCTNVLDANYRCHQPKCYCPRPDTLDECASLLARIGDEP